MNGKYQEFSIYRNPNIISDRFTNNIDNLQFVLIFISSRYFKIKYRYLSVFKSLFATLIHS